MTGKSTGGADGGAGRASQQELSSGHAEIDVHEHLIGVEQTV